MAMLVSRYWCIILASSALLIGLPVRAEDFASDYLLIEPGLTNAGEIALEQEIWVGSMRFRAVDAAAEIERIRISSPNLTVLDAPSVIEAGKECELEVAFTPQGTGLQTMTVELETSAGKLQSVFRAYVVAEDPLRALAMTWPVAVKPKNLITAGELLEQMREDPNDWTRMLIDVRPQGRYEQCHAVGAQSMFLHELRLRSELKSNRIYLIDDGIFEQSKLLEAIRLEQAGFESVKWVDGGLPEWVRAGGDLSAPFSKSSASGYGDEIWRVLKPLQLYYSAIRSEMHLILAGSIEDQQQAQMLFPNQKFYRWDSLETLDQITDQASLDTPMLVLGTREQGFFNIVSRLRDAGYNGVYTIDGGLDAMIGYLTSKQVTDPKFRTYSVRAGARNSKGKMQPKLKSEADCLTCN